MRATRPPLTEMSSTDGPGHARARRATIVAPAAGRAEPDHRQRLDRRRRANPHVRPAQDGIDFHESLEGMLVQRQRRGRARPDEQLRRAVPTVGPEQAAPAARTPRGRIGVDRTPDDFNPERFILDDVIGDDVRRRHCRRASSALVGRSSTTRSATTSTTHAGRRHAVDRQPRSARYDAVADGPDELRSPRSTSRTSRPADADGGKFDADSRDPPDRQPIEAPDVVAVEEVQDNDGARATPAATVTDASVDLAHRFIDAIATAARARRTSSARSTRPTTQDGGEPGGNIRVGFLFRTDPRAAFVDRPAARRPTSTATEVKRPSRPS